MVAVVSGSGLGLFGSSVSALGGAGAFGNAVVGRGRDSVYVNSATGNLVIQSQDDVLSALGLDLTLIRTYNSQGLLDDDNADNWRLGVHQRVFGLTGTVNTANSTIKKTFGDGREVLYTYDATRSAYVSTEGDGAHDTLSYNTGTSQWTWTDGSARNTEVYNGAGQLLQSRDADLNTITYTYSSGLLTQISDPSGQTTFLDYVGTNLDKVRVVSNGQTQTLTRYTYDGSNRLSQVTVDLSPSDNAIADGQVYTTTYTYDGTSKRIASITQTDGSSVAFTYEPIDGQYRVKTYTDAEGRITTLTYTLPSSTGTGSTTANANQAVLSTTDTQTTNTSYNLNTGALTADADALQNFVPKTGVSVAAGAWVYYTIEVPPGMSEMYVNLDATAGSSGDGALYVRRGAPPTTTTYDGYSDNDYTGNYLKESIFLQNPTPGTWYVGVYGYTSPQNAQLRVDFQSGTDQTLTLTPGQAVSNLDGSNGSLRAFSFNIAAGTSSLRLALSGLQDDGDLYLSYGAPVNLASPQYVSDGGTVNEVIDVTNPTAGTWYALVKSYSYVSDARLILHTNLGSNTPPAVEAGASQRVAAGTTVNLSATGSDAEGAVTYQWTQIGGPAVTLSNATTANASFTAPSASVSTLLSFRVRVTDSQGVTNTDVVHVTIDAPVLGYVVQATDTWQSIANTLYGVNSAAAGTALQTALNDPPLVAGSRLNSLPATLTVTTTTTVTVPAYYTVQSGDTWASITQTIYGTSNSDAIAALQAATGNPTLTTGLHLTVPLTLTYGGSGAGTLYQQTDVLDALGFTTTYTQDSAGRLTSVLSPTMSGSRIETRYAYEDSAGNVTKITQDPTGLNRITTLAYDPNGNLLTSRDSAGNTISRTYNANNQLLTETLYLVPDPDGPGAGQATVPLTTRYVYDGENHLRFAISAQGRVTEHRYNAAGQRITTLKYKGALYGATNFAESDLTTWSGTQDLTRLERTDYTYDFRGNLATLNVYVTTDSSGIGTGTPSLTQFVYDQRGQLLQTIEPRGSATVPNPATPNLPYATTYVYDGLGRVRQATQWISGTSLATTLTTYDDANRKTTTTLANGLVTTRTFNRAGELITLSNGTASVANSLGTTTYAYDADGRLRIVTDPSDVRQFNFYDEAGRKLGYVDGDGTLTEYIYDKANALIKTIRYAALIDSATLASLVDGSGNPTAVTFATVRTAASGNAAQDRITRNVYNTAGQLVFSIDEIGAVTQYFYDGAGRVTDEVRYTNVVTIARTVDQLLPSDISVTPAAATDRRTRYFYDSDGNLAGKLDAEGYLVEYLYDPAGYLFQQIAYATQTNSSYWLAGTLQQLRPALDNEIVTTPEADVVSYFFYDGQGRRIGTLDGEGYLTEAVYDTAGNITQTNRWDRKLTYTAGVSTFQTLRTAATAAPTPTVHTTTFQYDGAGRKTQETDYQGIGATYKYDPIGNLISTTRAASTSEARTTDTNYDLLGRALQELSAEGRAALDAISNPTPEQVTDIWNKYGVTYEYDLGGRRISATVRPNDTQTNKTVYYYDNDGRLRFEVNALGERKEYRYNALGQLTDEIRYSNRIATTGLNGGLLTTALTTTLTASANTGADARTTYTYSLTGRVATQTTAEGGSLSLTYNIFGEQFVRLEQVDAARTLRHEYGYDKRGLLTLTHWDPLGLNTSESRQYDAFGRLTQITDARGQTTRAEYDRLGREIATVDTLGGRRVTSYDAFSRVRKVWDALGNLTQYDYDDTTRSVVMTTPEGIAITTTMNRHGQTLTVVAAGNTTTYTYDANGQLSGASDSLGTLEGRTYDRGGRQITQTDARGTITSFAYDAANRVFTRTVDSATGGLALVTTYTYDGQGRVTRVEEPGNQITDTAYDRDGRITQVTVDPSGLNLWTSYAYDRMGHVITVTEGAGATAVRRTQHTYDMLGRCSEVVVDPTALGGTLNLRTTYEYDANGNVIRRIEGAGTTEARSTRYVYDAANRLTHTIDALNGVTATTYDAEGRTTSVRRFATTVDLSGLPLELTPTQIGNRLTLTTGDRMEAYVYDRDGRNVLTVDSIGGVTQKDFDANGNVIRQIHYDDRVPSHTYYATAQSVMTNVVADATKDRVQWTAYDLRGRAAFTVDALGSVVQFTYDGNDNVVSTTAFATPRATNLPTTLTALNDFATTNASNQQNRTTRFWYDAANRLRFKHDPERYLTETRYDDAARTQTEIVYTTPTTISGTATLTNVRDTANSIFNAALDQSTVLLKDAAGRLSRRTDASPAANYEEYTYDALDNVLTYRNQKGAIWTYVYDANGRLVDERSPQAEVTTIAENGASLTTSGKVTASIVTRTTYDALGNVKTRTEGIRRLPDNSEITTGSRTTSYSYDALGRQTRTTYPAFGVYDAAAGDVMLGNGAAITRTENSSLPLFTEVAYDTLGNAFRNRDVGGKFSYKVYDVLGRVQYEVDNEKYVTAYVYDTFGNVLTSTRHANPLTTALPTDGTSIGASDVTSKFTADSAIDRVITTTYDRLNRATQVTQASGSGVFNYRPDSGATSGGSSFTASPTTLYEYNAFGQAVRMRQLVQGSTYADTYMYYDRRGLKTAAVTAADATKNYLTTYEYDETGDLTKQIEYSRPVTGTVSISSFGTIVVTTPSTSPGNSNGYDRETRYAYDKLNRRISETKVAVEHTSISGTTTSTVVADQVTTFGYDAVGNLVKTSVNGANTYTYFDALGRIIAVAEPTRDRGDGASITPFVLMGRDAYGNLVEEIRFANTATGVSETGYTPPTANPDPEIGDRVTRLFLDAYGHALRVEDGVGADRYASYDEYGNVAKEWQPVVNNDSATEYLVTLYKYDGLGRQTSITEPQRHSGATTVSVVSRATYNAFGEVIAKSVDGMSGSEYFEYDRAGRLWRTNSGDGVHKVYLYDLAGNVTAEIRSQTRNLQTYVSSAQGAWQLPAGEQMRTETVYDWLGRVIEQRQATFDAANPRSPLTTLPTVSMIGGTPYLVIQGVIDFSLAIVLRVNRNDGNGLVVVPMDFLSGDENGYQMGFNLTGLATGTYAYEISNYRAGDEVPSAQATGTFSITNTTNSSLSISAATLGSVSNVQVYGSETGELITWTSSVGALEGRIEIWNGSSWQSYDAGSSADEAGSFIAFLPPLAPGSYTFRIFETINGVTVALATGTLTTTGSSTTTTATALTPAAAWAAVGPISASGTAVAQASGSIASSAYQTQVPIYDENNQIIGYAPAWGGTNVVNASWLDVGTSTINVVVAYRTATGLDTSRSWNLSNAATGAQFSWTDTVPGDGTYGHGGISQINYVAVYDANWNLIRYSGSTSSNVRMSWAAPPQSTAGAYFWYAPAGTTNLSVVTAVRSGGSFIADLPALANGTYDWYVLQYPDINDESASTASEAGGQFSVSGSSVTILSQVGTPSYLSGVTASGQYLNWNATPVAGDVITVQLNGGAYALTPEPLGGGNYRASFFNVPSGTYTYTIEYARAGTTYLRGTGSITIQTTVNPPTATITQSPSNAAAISGFAQSPSNGNIVTWTPAPESGSTVRLSYKAAGAANWATTVTLPAGSTSYDLSALSGAIDYEVTYTRSGELTAYRVGGGRITITRTVNTTGTIADTTAITLAPQPATPRQTQTVDRWGNALSVTDPANQTTNYRYNRFNQVTQIIQPQVEVVAVAQSNGAITTTPNGTPTSFNYFDVLGRLIGTRDANGNLNTVGYNPANQQIIETHADGGVKRYVYNAFGEMIQTTDEGVFHTRNRYDRAGRLIAVAQEVTSGAFGNNDPYSVPAFTAANVVVMQYGYDDAGRRVSETSGELMEGSTTQAETTRNWYDLQGNLVRRRTPRGRDTTYTYDAQGKKTGETNAIGDDQSWTYDYFGHLTGHIDLGDVSYGYAYNTNAWLLTQQTNTLGQNQSFTYDAAGHLTRIDDTGTGVSRITRYDYDAAGRRMRTRTTIQGVDHENTRTDFDALGRIRHMTGLGFSLTYSYDAAGNRTHISGNYSGGNHTEGGSELWYQYDSMNRVTVSQGVNVDNVVTIDTFVNPSSGDNYTQGTRLTYDTRGNRTSATTYANRLHIVQTLETYSASYVKDETTESYGYDGLGRLTSTNLETILEDWLLGTQNTTTAVDSRSYDRASRVTGQTTFTLEPGAITRVRTTTYTDDGFAQTQTTTKNGATESIVTYGDSTFQPPRTVHVPAFPEPYDYFDPGGWSVGFDAAGNLRGYLVSVYNPNGTVAYRSTNKFDYRLGESYQQSGHQIINTAGGPLDGSTTNAYNVNGELIQFTDTQDQNKNRYFANNAAGQALTVVKGRYDGQSGRLTAQQAFQNAVATDGFHNSANAGYFLYAPDGSTVGSFGQLDGTLKANFDVNYEPISDEYPGQVPQQYVVQSGDTLRIVAAKLFGDGSLWYVIAQANGLSDPDVDLPDGISLVIPNDVISLSNSFDTFKPFNVTNALGDTTPTQPLPPPPKPKKKGCGTFGKILMLVVAIVVTIYTAGAASGLAASSSYGGTFAAGSAVVTGAAGINTATVAAAAVGGAVGSIASQVVGIATGVQEGFDWKGVALGAIGAGVTAGIGGIGGGVGLGARATAALQVPAGIAKYASVAINAAAASAITQGIAVATGLQSSFNWREVAISAASAPVAAAVGQGAGALFAGAGPGVSQFANRFAGGVAGSMVRRAFGGKVDMTTVLTDSFGNALGNSIVEGMSGPRLEEVHPTARRIGGSSPMEELQEVQITARRLDMNPNSSIVDPLVAMTPDEQRNARSSQAIEEVQVTALRRSDPLAGIEEIVVSAPRMGAQEARAYDAREALRMTLSGILTQHGREQDARNMVEAEMTAGQRALVSLGGIMYNGYQSVKSGVVGLKDLAVSAYEWDQRVIGDLLHGDIRAAAGEYADLFGLGAEKAKAFLTGAQNVGAVLADAESRQMLMDFAQEYYGTSSQITQSELLGKLPMELLIAAGTAGAGEVISAAGIPQRIGGAINSLADALRTTDVRFPVVLDANAISANGVGAIKGLQSPFVRDGGVYVLRDPVTGNVVRTGRTNDLTRREAELYRDPALGDYRFEPVYRTNDYAEQRGLEQHIYMKYPDAEFNYIRPISPVNRRIDEYIQAAADYLKRLGQ